MPLSQATYIFFFIFIVMAMYSSKRCNRSYKACPTASSECSWRASQEGRIRERAGQGAVEYRAQRRRVPMAHSRRMMRIKRKRVNWREARGERETEGRKREKENEERAAEGKGERRVGVEARKLGSCSDRTLLAMAEECVAVLEALQA